MTIDAQRSLIQKLANQLASEGLRRFASFEWRGDDGWWAVTVKDDPEADEEGAEYLGHNVLAALDVLPSLADKPRHWVGRGASKFAEIAEWAGVDSPRELI